MTMPSAVRLRPIASSSTPSASGQGINPADIPIAATPRRPGGRSAGVFVVPWPWPWPWPGARSPAARRRRDQPDPEHEHHDPGRDRQHRHQTPGTTYRPARSTAPPRASTAAVWLNVITPPSATACRGVPRPPTR